MFKINNNSLLGNFNFVYVNQIHSYQTRAASSGNFYVEGNNIPDTSITKVGPKVWRKLPHTVKNLNFNLFKKSVKSLKIAAYKILSV